MKIIQVICKDTTLSLGDKIVVEFKPLLNDEEQPSETKEITIREFRPYDDSSNDIWMVDENGEVYADENFVSKKIKVRLKR